MSSLVERENCVDKEELLREYARLLKNMHELTLKQEMASLDRFRCEKRLEDVESSMIKVVECPVFLNETGDDQRIIQYLLDFKREQEELLKKLKACIANCCELYNLQIKDFLDMNTCIQDSPEAQKMFRNYERSLHPSHYFFKIVTKKVDIQYQRALLGLREQAQTSKELIWSFRTRISVILSILLQTYAGLKFEYMRVATPLMVDIKFNTPYFFITFVENHVYAYFIEKNKKDETIQNPNLMDLGMRHRVASAVLEDNKTSEELFYHPEVAQFFQNLDPYWDN